MASRMKEDLDRGAGRDPAPDPASLVAPSSWERPWSWRSRQRCIAARSWPGGLQERRILGLAGAEVLTREDGRRWIRFPRGTNYALEEGADALFIRIPEG